MYIHLKIYQRILIRYNIIKHHFIHWQIREEILYLKFYFGLSTNQHNNKSVTVATNFKYGTLIVP